MSGSQGVKCNILIFSNINKTKPKIILHDKLYILALGTSFDSEFNAYDIKFIFKQFLKGNIKIP